MEARLVLAANNPRPCTTKPLLDEDHLQKNYKTSDLSTNVSGLLANCLFLFFPRSESLLGSTLGSVIYRCKYFLGSSFELTRFTIRVALPQALRYDIVVFLQSQLFHFKL